jgi:hypothetical protein
MKNPKLEQDHVALWLNNLPDHVFTEFFHKHLSSRHVFRAEERCIDSHLVLGVARRVRDVQEWKLQILCPTPNQDSVDDAPVCQFRTHCGNVTASASKKSKRPLCGDTVSGS